MCVCSLYSVSAYFGFNVERIDFNNVFPPELDQPPVAHVLSSPPVSLPARTATLDGSHTTDDKGGVTYLWTRDDSSPAAGVSDTFSSLDSAFD